MTGTCENCGTDDTKVNDVNKCVNCAAGLPRVDTGDSDQEDNSGGDESKSADDGNVDSSETDD